MDDFEVERILSGGNVRERMTASLATWACSLLYHRGKPLRLDRHKFMVPIYNTAKKRLLLKCGRQVAKSTSLNNILLTRSFLTPSLRVLYVSPSAQQTRQFSNEKIRPTLLDSPMVMKYFFNERTCINQTYEKTFMNGSHMFLRYAFLTADRARGIPCEILALDELQDILKDNARVIAESLSAASIMEDDVGGNSSLGVEIDAGTPKTMENTIEEYWSISSQNEWFVPCDRHTPRHWNFLDIKVIGKEGPICNKCGSPINPLVGQWVSLNKGGDFWGFRISQLMVPWKLRPDRWKSEIVFKLDKWPSGLFHNEVLGISYDSAQKPINTSDVQRCCWPIKQIENIDSSKYHAIPSDHTRRYRLFGGIDYGEGREEGKMDHGRKRPASFTVFTVGAYVTSDIFWTIYQKRYKGNEIDPDFIKEDVLRLINIFGVEVLGADWGHGWGINSFFFKRLGPTKVMQFQYSDNLAERKKWDPGGWKYIINRNAVVSDFINSIKEEKHLFPAWEEFKPFANDILAVYADYNSRTKRMYFDHPIDQPDDAMHSSIYARLAADVTLGRF